MTAYWSKVERFVNRIEPYSGPKTSAYNAEKNSMASSKKEKRNN